MMNTHDEVVRTSVEEEEEINKTNDDTSTENNEVKDPCVVVVKNDDETTDDGKKLENVGEYEDKCNAIPDELWFKLVDFKILVHSKVATTRGKHKNSSQNSSLLHLEMFLDEDLRRIVTKYEENRNGRKLMEVANEKATQWFSKDSEWVKKSTTENNPQPSSSKDYLQDLIRNNQPANGLISVSKIETELTRAAKAEQLKNEIRANIKVINSQFERMKKDSKREPTARSRTESQSSSSSSKRSKDTSSSSHKQITINQKPLSKEEFLILSLLALESPVEREQYLIKVAKERNLLQRNDFNNTIVLTSKYGGVFPIIKRQAKQNIEQMAPCVLQLHGCQKKIGAGDGETPRKERKISTQVTESGKKPKFKPDTIKKELTYHEQVMQIVNEVEELPTDLFKLKYNFKMPKQPLTDAMYQEYIDRFVASLVEKNAGHLHTGEIRINSKNYGQAFVNDKEAKDVFIGTPCLRRFALQGDLVEIYVHHGIEVEVAEPVNETNSSDESVLTENGAENGEIGVEPTTKPRKLGFVTRILEKRHNRNCVGTFSDRFSKESKSARFVPRDAKMPVIHIPKQNWPNALLLEDPKDVENVVYLAEIIDWKDDRAIGNILKSLGKCGDLEVENEAILVSNNLDVTPFSEEIISQLPQSPFIIPPEEFERRKDLRKITIFTIDPLTARDLDDALSCRRLENGNYEIGVHISDVSYFLKEGTPLDDLVKEKATSIYMIDNVYHMLPKPLCLLCSLLPGKDKLAFSVFWEMTEDATIKSTRFARTIINSCTQFAYEHAQKIIETPDETPLDPKDFPQIGNGVELTEIRETIKILQKLALKLRENRMKNGALKIDQPKLSFRLDPNTGMPKSYAVYELKEANRMIEDWMLLANCTVAAFIFKFSPKNCILRNHAHPSDNSMDNLEGLLKKFDLVLNGRTSMELRNTMEEIINGSESPEGARTVMNVLLSKPMQRAKYFCSGYASKPEDFYHFALAVKIYTHFTSPIRRYADVMVHRTLAATLKYETPSQRTPAELQCLANICNMQKWNAKNAGDECSDLYFRTYLNTVGSIKTRAAVMAIGSYSLEVVLMETGHSVKIFYKYLEPNTIVRSVDEAKITKIYMYWPKEINTKPRKITLFSELMVEVTAQKTKLAINRVFSE